jgi:hypothetical protein
MKGIEADEGSRLRCSGRLHSGDERNQGEERKDQGKECAALLAAMVHQGKECAGCEWGIYAETRATNELLFLQLSQAAVLAAAVLLLLSLQGPLGGV